MEGSKYTSKYLDAPARAAYDRVGLWWSAGARRAAVRVRDHGRGLGVKHEEARADAQRGGQNKGIMLVFYTFSTRYTRYPVYPGTRACGSRVPTVGVSLEDQLCCKRKNTAKSAHSVAYEKRFKKWNPSVNQTAGRMLS